MNRKVLYLLPKRSHDNAHATGALLADTDYAFADIRKLGKPDKSPEAAITDAELACAAEVFIERRYRRSPWMRKQNGLYRKAVYAGARKDYRRIYSTLRQHQPTHVIVNNGLRLPESLVPIACAKLGIQPLFQEAGMIPGFLQIDPRGVNYKNCVPRDPAFYDNYMGANPDPFIDSDGPIFIPFQVDYDTQIICYSDWVKSMENLLHICKELAQAVPQKQFVIKEHPMAKIKLETTDLPANLRFENDGDTKQLIANAEAVITVNSTVGMEAILARKKTIVLGQACYGIEGLAILARSQDELVAKVKNLDEVQPSAALRDAYIRYLREEFLVDKTSAASRAEGTMRALLRDPQAEHCQLNLR